MSFSAFLRPLVAVFKSILSFLRRPFAERRAVRMPEKERHSMYKVMDNTLVHIGVEPSLLLSTSERWRLELERKIVIGEPFTFPHVREWLNTSVVQDNLKQLAAQTLTHESTDLNIEHLLIKSYIGSTGENEAVARGIISQAVKTIVTGTISGLHDPDLAPLLKLHTDSVHQRLNVLTQQLLPQYTLSLKVIQSDNVEWLTETFSSRSKAKTRLGQFLCPEGAVAVLHRKALCDGFSASLSSLPDGGVLVVTGPEGNGKSWLVAQAWMSLPSRPITAFIPAESVDDNANDLSDVVISALCRSSTTEIPVQKKFWQAQFHLWRDAVNRPENGLIVIVDGINQRPNVQWALYIDRLSESLELIGGKIILTSRQHYFSQAVEPRLVSSFTRCPVPEWSVDERDEILALRNINITGKQLTEKVAASLCNPRLLGIALTLFNESQLQDLQELSVSLMLFEHIKASQRESYEMSAEVFSRHLCLHGRKVLERFELNGKDDLDVFDADLTGAFIGGLHAVADGRFFVPLPGDATRYRIESEGLSLALGLAILDVINSAVRNEKNLDEAMATVIEPVMALDKTSDALFAALTVACLDTQHPEETGITILAGFAGLQNPDNQFLQAFMALSRLRPVIFIRTCEHLSLHNKNLIRHHWIQMSLLQSARDPSSAETVLLAATQWLLWAPSLFVLSSKGGAEDADTSSELETLKQERKQKIALLSPDELLLFDRLTFKETDSFSILHLLAIKLLAGHALTPRADALVGWCFLHSLISDHGEPWQAFRDLVAFNAVDWHDMRAYLQTQFSPLLKTNISTVGKWCAVEMLMATGHTNDARQAESLIQVLREGNQHQKGWHINERWCEADPCNPSNSESKNVENTAQNYDNIDVSQLFNQFGRGYDEASFIGAATSLARYYPLVAIEGHRRLAENVLQRNGMPLRQGVFALSPHRALITQDLARRFAQRVVSDKAEDVAAWLSLGKESDVIKQFQLSLAFHQFSASEQITILNKFRPEEGVFTVLSDSLKPLSWLEIEQHLLTSIEKNQPDLQAILLRFVDTSGPFPEWFQNLIPQLLESTDKNVQIQMMLKVIESSDSEALQISVKYLITKQFVEEEKAWYASVLTFKAIEEKAISWEQAGSLLNDYHAAHLAGLNRGAIAEAVATRFDIFINRALNEQINLDSLQITKTLKSIDDRTYSLHQLCEIDSLAQNNDDLSALTQNTIESFEERQESLFLRYRSFKAMLAERDLSALTHHVYPSDLEALIAAKPDRAVTWARSILDEKYTASLPAVRHIGLVLAQVLSSCYPDMSVALFKRLEGVEPFNKVVFTDASLELCAVAVWSAAESEEIRAYRLHRIATARNNEALAKEVWAALFCKQEASLYQFIQDYCQSSWPVEQARGIMMAGYAGQNKLSDKILSKNIYSGRLQRAVKSANDSYQRHLWTLHWYSLMCRATSAEAFWCASVVFLQVVGEKFLALQHDEGQFSEAFRQYWPCVEKELGSRFRKPRGKRMEALLGDKAPWPGFLPL